ncbi:long-chain acyl-CoA synthetase [Streptomyces spiroverticillatus]|uniref:Long-chain acyl-CoA synthetase n=1 Tax=Streptomyces finlayi TaxID=67296 RepID=A0A918X4W2_9ACTN|nr:class I adenylate-forming enzyme family protein [Streptomyces finlayi]GHA36085.1 long-chain acyl-CoA synthetase [Streptomyces spiroverticillatus]GHD12454.1 long-chain acyl-CoA synthetase [Streptomyces finlayi]
MTFLGVDVTTLERTKHRLIGSTGTEESAALRRRVHTAAAELVRRGVRAGDRVLVQADNSTDYVVALLALMQVDVSVVPVDPRQAPADVGAAARQSRARWLLTDRRPPSDPVGGRVLVTAELGRAGAGDGAYDGEVDLSSWFRRRDAVVLWSSGTTGRPKGIVKSGSAVLDNTERTALVMGYSAQDVMVPLLPFSHQYGLSVVLLWWQAGCTLVVTPYQRLDLALSQAVAHGVTCVDAAPPTYHALLGVARRRPALRAQLGAVRVWGVGGAPLPAPLAKTFRAEIGTPLLDGYGLSELGNVALATPEVPVACGRPLPGVGVRVVAPDGRPAAPGELGRIEVRSPGRMEGYLTEEGELVPADDGWFRTGDVGSLDAGGLLYVSGRDRAVHRLGYTIFPESLERKAEECGRQIKIVPVADVRRGHALHFVVADPDGHSALTWRRRIAPHLADFEQPNAVHVVDSFPVSLNGKIDTTALRQLIGVAS